MTTRILIFVVVSAMCVVGCDRRRHKAGTTAPAGPVRTGTGVIRGVVMLAGKPPEMATIPNAQCHADAAPLKDESVVVDSAGHLQNVIVYLEDAPPAPPASNLAPVGLDQVDCRYVPHVAVLRVGQTLHVASSDPTLHNVHGLCVDNPAFNFALIGKGQSKDMRFDEPELFPVRCDVHPWMKAFVQVFAQPYFAVTGPDGSFEIRNVPPGTYKLISWHEKYGTQHIPVTATDGQTATPRIVFQSGL